MACIWGVLFLCFIIAFVFYWYLKNSKNYLEDLEIPFVKNNKLSVIKLLIKTKFTSGNNFHEIEIEKYRKYGRLYGTSEEGIPAVSISHPDLLKKILVKDFHIFNIRKDFGFGDDITSNFLSIISGEKWKRIRTIISPAFSTGKIKRMTDIVISSAKTLTENFASAAGKPIDGKKFFNSFSMDVIASVAFGTKIHSHNDPNNRFVQEANKFFGGNFSWQMIFFVLCPKVAHFFGMDFMDKKMVKFFTDATLGIIEDRKKNGTVKNDFLQLMMEAEKEYEKGEDVSSENSKTKSDEVAEELCHDEGNANIFKYTKRYKSLSGNEILAQCLIFFFAGFDTVTTILTCAFYELAVNPDIQEKLRKEIDSTIAAHNNQLTYEAIQEMGYLDKCVTETLRKYPPVFRLERRASADYELEGAGIIIKKGTAILIPICALHQDEEYYPDPELFDPERFSAENKATRHPYSFLPFGAGPRNCVAMRFALMEVKLCIAYVLSQLIIKKCPETEVPMKLTSPMGFLKPHTTFMAEKRNNIILRDNH